MADNMITRLQRFFGFTSKVSKNNAQSREIIPVDRRSKDGKKPLNLPSELKRIWDWWLNENHDTAQTLKNRDDRIKDLEYMRFNDGVISMAAELYADEAVQADSQNEILKATAKSREVEKVIYELFDTWGLDQAKIRAICDDIAFYGEGFTIDGIDMKLGVVSMTHTDVKTFKSRMEFKAAEAQKEFNQSMANWRSLMSKNAIMKQLADIIDNVEIDYSKYFEPFLFGYGIENDIFLPPWAVSHFRMKTSMNEFFPWGKSLFIYCIALFRQLSATKNLMGVARLSALPKERFQIKVDDNMSAAEQWAAIEEAKEEYQNISSALRSKEEWSIGHQIWLPKDLVEYDLVSGDINMNEIKDVELLRDDMIIATGVPKGFLIVDRGSFGTSGQSLLQQYKPFGRRVFSVQGAFLSELAAKIRLHFMITEQFDGENTDFSLSMNFPVVEEARDRMSAKGDSFRLATDIINGIKDVAGLEGDLPVDIVKDIFSHLSFLSPEEINDWVEVAFKVAKKEKDAAAEEEKAAAEAENSLALEQISEKTTKEAALRKKAKERITEDIIRGVAFDSMKSRRFKEGVMGKRHYLNSSTNITFSDKIAYEMYKKLGNTWTADREIPRKKK